MILNSLPETMSGLVGRPQIDCFFKGANVTRYGEPPHPLLGLVQLVHIQDPGVSRNDGTYYLSGDMGRNFFVLIQKGGARPAPGSFTSTRFELPDLGEILLVANHSLDQMEIRFPSPFPTPWQTIPLKWVPPRSSIPFPPETRFRGLPNSLDLIKAFAFEQEGHPYHGHHLLLAQNRHPKTASRKLAHIDPSRLSLFFGPPRKIVPLTILEFERNGRTTSIGTEVGTFHVNELPFVNSRFVPHDGSMIAGRSYSCALDDQRELGVHLEANDPAHSRTRPPGNQVGEWTYPVLSADQVERRILEISGLLGIALELSFDQGLTLMAGGTTIYLKDIVGFEAYEGNLYAAIYQALDQTQPTIYEVDHDGELSAITEMAHLPDTLLGRIGIEGT